MRFYRVYELDETDSIDDIRLLTGPQTTLPLWPPPSRLSELETSSPPFGVDDDRPEAQRVAIGRTGMDTTDESIFNGDGPANVRKRGAG